jgi:uncharacterized protein (DUF1501 family)
MQEINNARRYFLKSGSAVAASSAFGLGWWSALAQAASVAAPTATDYKALVCIYLEGGNDACGTILPPLDDGLGSYDRYVAVRGDKLAIQKATVQAGMSNPDNPWPFIDSYPLHPRLKNVSNLYKNKQLAVVANVGNIRAATARSNVESELKVLARLRSHNDQTNVWLNGRDNMATTGWGGKAVQQAIATFQSSSSVTSPAATQNFRSIALGNPTAFGTGFVGGDAKAPVGSSTVTAYGMVRGEGVVPLLPDAAEGNAFGVPVNTVVQSLVTGKFKTPRTNLLELDYADTVRRALESRQYMNALLRTVSVPAVALEPMKDDKGNVLAFPPAALAEDLRMVANVIKANVKADVKGRQVFYVSLGSFDIHTDGQRQSILMHTLDQSLQYFVNAMGQDINKVVAFTASEFGRLLHGNGDGLDHGWGGHHLVLGGSVKGAQILGNLPDYHVENGQYSNSQMMDDGALIPAVSIDTYASKLLSWLDIKDSATLDTIFGADRAKVGDLSNLL